MDSERIAVLERQVNRLQRVTVMLGAGFLLLLVWRLVPSSPTVTARQFLMKDASGVIRGALMMLDDGRPTLRLNDKNGRPRTMLYLNPDAGGALRFTDLRGHHRLQLLLTPEGEPEIRFENRDGVTRTRLGLTVAHRPAISIADPEGRPVWASPLR